MPDRTNVAHVNYSSAYGYEVISLCLAQCHSFHWNITAAEGSFHVFPILVLDLAELDELD